MLRGTIVKAFGLWVVFGLGSCASSTELVTVLLEDSKGNTELTYLGTTEPAKLVKEVRFSIAGDTSALTNLAEGALHGQVVTFHPNGKRKELITYSAGKQNGPYQAFDTEGAVVFEGALLEGKKNGPWSYWYDETQMKQQCNYANDLLSGKCTYWYIDGNLKREETYSDGKLIAEKDH